MTVGGAEPLAAGGAEPLAAGGAEPLAAGGAGSLGERGQQLGAAGGTRAFQVAGAATALDSTEENYSAQSARATGSDSTEPTRPGPGPASGQGPPLAASAAGLRRQGPRLRAAGPGGRPRPSSGV